jgi:hypothetical protein
MDAFYMHQFLLSEGNLLDLDLGVLCGFPPFFFLLYLSIEVVAYVKFG